MFKFSFDRPAGRRVLKGMFDCGITADGGGYNFLWYAKETGIWSYEMNNPCSSHDPIKVNSIKSFKRYLRKHPELHIAGTTVCLVSRYKPVDSFGEYSILATFIGDVK